FPVASCPVAELPVPAVRSHLPAWQQATGNRQPTDRGCPFPIARSRSCPFPLPVPICPPATGNGQQATGNLLAPSNSEFYNAALRFRSVQKLTESHSISR